MGKEEDPKCQRHAPDRGQSLSRGGVPCWTGDERAGIPAVHLEQKSAPYGFILKKNQRLELVSQSAKKEEAAGSGPCAGAERDGGLGRKKSRLWGFFESKKM